MDIRRKEDKREDGLQGAAKKDSSKSSGASGSGVLGTVFVIFGLVALAGLGFYFADTGGGEVASVDDGPVAIVNGQEIAGSQLQEQLEGFRNSTGTQAQQFNSLSETRQQEILLEGIINTELQLQAAEGAGVTVSDSEVETELQNRIDQIGADEFERRLADNDVTREEVRDDLRKQLIISQYIQQEAGDLSATDAEVQQLYQQYSAQLQQASGAGTSSDAIPALEQIRPDIEAAVIQQKQQQVASELLAQARQNADIEVLLEGVSYPASSANPTGAPAPAQQQQPAEQPEQPAEETGQTPPSGQ